MRTKLRSWRQQIKQHPIATGFIVLLVLILFIFLAYSFAWDWTGFSRGTNQITIISTSKGNYTAILSQPSKSLWDWLGLLAALAIPIVVGFGVAWYTAQQGKVSERENKDNQHEQALQAYIDKMSELLLEKRLRESQPEDEVRKVARVRTLTILPHLDEKRKRSVLQFLLDAKLIDKGNRKIDLHDADLTRADLHGIGLTGADLHGANLTGADLHGAYLTGVSLWNVDLREANLIKANMWGTELDDADLTNANLT